jgi:hypothetical protein
MAPSIPRVALAMLQRLNRYGVAVADSAPLLISYLLKEDSGRCPLCHNKAKS